MSPSKEGGYAAQKHIGEFSGEPDWSLIPAHMHEGIRGYVETGRPVGGFLTAVLTNDLREAAERADEENQRALYEWIRFLYCYAPAGCWGSPELVAEWYEHARLAREAELAS